MKKYILFLISSLLVISCGTKRQAIGAADELMIVVSSEHQNEINSALAEIFNDTLYTPKPEPIYKFVNADPHGFEELKRQSNLVVGSIGTDESIWGTKLVKSLLGDELFEKTINGDEQIIFSEDQFGRDQLFMIISGNSIDDIKQELEVKSVFIKSYFDKIFETKQKKYLFGNDRLKKLTERFKSEYGWELQIPWGWEIIKEIPDSNFIWLGRELPYQWFSIHWQEGFLFEQVDEASIYARQFPLIYYKNIQINDYKFETELVKFNNWSAWRSQGIWESLEQASGGPFINYTWYDEKSNRTYNLNMLVFIPNKNKSTFMRQLDIIAHTFSTQ